jgi:hypothetical protein
MSEENKNKLKSGPKPKPVCKNGHDISVVGRTKSGNCKQCKSDYYRIRREFIKKYFNEKQP